MVILESDQHNCKLCKEPVDKETYDLLKGYHDACENELSSISDKPEEYEG